MSNMMKRIVSLLLCMVLVAGNLPSVAWATETEAPAETTAPTAAQTEPVDADQEAADAVAALIAELPALEEIKGKDLDAQAADYAKVYSAYSAYDVLTDAQKALLPPAEEVFKPYFDYFNSQTQEAGIIASGTNNKINWVLDDAGTLTLTGTGALNMWGSTDSPWYDYRASVKKAVIGSGITEIRSYQFYDCYNMTSVSIPSTVTEISWSAFEKCKSLTSITLPAGITEIHNWTFRNCESLTKITIPSGVTRIGQEAFYGCYSMSSVSIPSTVTEIGSQAFFDCEKLTSIQLPAGLTTIASGTFYYCRGLTSITIPSKVTDIGDEAFRFCESLKTVTMPSGVTSIGRLAFESCEALTGVSLPSALKTIGDNAFESCTSLTSITIPKSVTSMGKNPFRLCSKLSTISVASGSTSFRVSSGALYTYDYSKLITFPNTKTGSYTVNSNTTTIGAGAFTANQLTSISLPSALTTIENGAFSRSVNLTKIVIPSRVTSLDTYTFYNCQKLNSITLPAGLTNLGEDVFTGCKALTSITIPKNVSKIGGYCFMGCYALADITFTGSAPTMGNYALYGLTANGYYPASDASWTDAVQSTYGGTITWVPVYAIVAEGTCGTSLTWKLDEAGKLTISGTGAMTDYTSSSSYTNNAPWKNYADDIKSVVVEKGVISIGAYAFYKCKNLTDVSLADSVISIGQQSFDSCSSLKNIKMSANLTTIGQHAFYQNSALTSINIPASVTSIGDYAFASCTGLTSITVDGSNTSYRSQDGVLFTKDMTTLIYYPEAKTGAYTIPDGVETIANTAFSQCSGLTAITFPDSVTIIESSAFDSCTGLTELKLPSALRSIYTYAFYGCKNLKTVRIPESLRNIYASAFLYCSNIELVYYGGTQAQWNNIYFAEGNGAVKNCFNIIYEKQGSCGEKVNHTFFDGTLTILGTGPMTDFTTASEQPWYSYRNQITKIVVEDGVTTIGDFAFYQCEMVESVSIGKDVKVIGKNAFYYCNLGKLPEIKLPEGLTTIRYGAFWGCTHLKSMVVPASVTSIDNSAFQYCDRMSMITFKGDFPNMAANGNHFYNLPALTVYYPANNGTWISDVLLQYGNNRAVTWIATCGNHSYAGAEPTYVWADDYSKCTATINCIGAGCEEKKTQTVRTSSSVVSEATCVAEGKTIYTAAFTTEPFTTQTKEKIIPATGVHVFDETTHKCTCGIYGGTCGTGVTWTLVDGILTISGTGSMDDFAQREDMPWYGCRSEITTVVVEPGVTKIGQLAFSQCANLQSVSLPNDLTEVGNYAFEGCGIQNLVLPKGLVSLGDMVFRDCVAMTTVTLPDSVTTVGRFLFTNCTMLQTVKIPAGLTEIPDGMFDLCAALETITIPETVTSIGQYAFDYCEGLKRITFEGTAPAIHRKAFSGVEATAYYPRGYESWNADTLKNYSGTITWKMYCRDGVHLFNQEVAAEEYLVSEATCTAKAVYYKSCECGETGTETFDYGKLKEHDYKAVVTPPTCTEDGYTIHTCSACGDFYTDSPVGKLGHDMGEWVITQEPTADAAGEERSDCSRCDYFDTRPIEQQGNVLTLEGEDLLNQNTVWINGLPYPVEGEGENRYVVLPGEEDCLMVTYTYHVGDASDVHTQYPTGMKVYRVTSGDAGFKAEHIPELDNLLQYSGSSIRITGKKGIRMITSLTKENKAALTGKGLGGYKLLEYGTALCWVSEIAAGDALVLGRPFTRSNHAYKKDVADPVFATSGNLIQYTNVLVGFTNDQCKDDIAMRPYIILEDAQGNQVTLYGGTIYRSIGYIAYQNRGAFKPGTGSYNYVWEIIHHVYGDKYDAEYKG